VIKVDRPLRSGFSQPGSPYGHPCSALPSFSNGNGYRAQSMVGSVGRPAPPYHNMVNDNPSFSSASSFEYAPPPPNTMMMMQPTPTAAPQQMGIMQQAAQPMSMMPAQTQMMYRQVPMGSPMMQPNMAQNFIYPMPHPGMSFGYRPMMQQAQQQARMIPSGMPMMPPAPTSAFASQPSMFNPMAQQMVY
jgi:hypothetical protein